MKRGSSLRLIEWPMPPTSGEVRGVAMASDSFLARPRFLLARPRCSGGVLDGLDDVVVPRAPAEVAGDGPADVGFGGVRIRLQKRAARHHHAGGAVAALQTVLLVKALLDRVELSVFLEALDGRDVAAVGLDREHRAGLDRHSVEQHRTGAAVRGVAPDVGAREAQALAQEVDEQQARLDLARL